MPGNVQLAIPQGVFPYKLARSYQRQRKYEMRTTWFPDGSNVRKSYVASDQSAWVLTTRLQPSDVTVLLNFYSARGPYGIPFWYYDMDETRVFDPTGVATLGRYTVRFQGKISTTGTFPRLDSAVTLLQIA
jgi:hypothetical protein